MIVKMRETSYKTGKFGYFRNSKGKRSKSTATSTRRNIVLHGETDLNAVRTTEILKLETTIDVGRRPISLPTPIQVNTLQSHQLTAILLSPSRRRVTFKVPTAVTIYRRIRRSDVSDKASEHDDNS
jgi:hypothetical protein